MLNIRKKCEYRLKHDGILSHWIVTDILRDKNNKLLTITAKKVEGDACVTFSAEKFLTAVECINKCEIFIMYTNWQNFLREGPHQDLIFAEKVRISILSSLALRGWVREGHGKFELSDFKIVRKIKLI